MAIAVLNMGGVRGEDVIFADLDAGQTGARGCRVEMPTETLLPAVVETLRQHTTAPAAGSHSASPATAHSKSAVFKGHALVGAVPGRPQLYSRLHV